MSISTFDKFFFAATGSPIGSSGRTPYPYQREFANGESLPTLLNVPTGVGKTATAILGWLYRRREHPDDAVRSATPRRLVYCLPMRTLVEQTKQVACDWLENLKLSEVVDARILMGGNDSADWDRNPEREAILIGTQDMLLSRALNRGYGMSRYRWPVHFGLLNNDCLWVMDETQLMGVGLTTTAQLQGFRETLKTFGTTHSLWMSATLDTSPINTVDHLEPPGGFSSLRLTEEDKDHDQVKLRLNAKKTLEKSTTVLDAPSEKGYAKALASAIQSSHRPGTLTLVVLNRVSRAQEVFSELEKSAKKATTPAHLALVHARFRPRDRKWHEDQLFSKNMPPPGRIVVATQAIEAGVDVSAATMFTELAPWPSLVQRFGRCNRGGEFPDACVVWIDVRPKDDKDKLSLPYDIPELDKSRAFLETLENVGPASLGAIADTRPLAVVHTIRRKDLLDLWDTTPDLAGNDLDVSRFIREGDDNDVQFYWRRFDDDHPPETFPTPQREELCSVAIGRAREFLKKLKDKSPAFVWNTLERSWRKVDADEVRPGMVLLLKPEMGGYLDAIGWTGDPKDKPAPYPPESSNANESIEDDPDTELNRWVELTDHLQDVTQAVERSKVAFKDEVKNVPWSAIVTAARWHDVGKAHPAFQNMLLAGRSDADSRRTTYWAKSDGTRAGRSRCFVDGPRGREERIGFRHELASALAWLKHHPEETDTNLIAFLIASHHGKVRASIRSLPNEKPPADGGKFARGVRDDDELPIVTLDAHETMPATTLNLSLMELGEGDTGPSWLARVLALREEFGPFRLSFLETLLRVADWRGSDAGDNRQ